MKKYSLKDFKGGWFVGSFSPAILNTNEFEVAVKKYKAGEEEPNHYHKIADEITVIINGKALINGQIVSEGEVVLIEKGQAAKFISLTDSTTCVVKTPSIIGDKYETN